jgi:hypothetical protein
MDLDKLDPLRLWSQTLKPMLAARRTLRPSPIALSKEPVALVSGFAAIGGPEYQDVTNLDIVCVAVLARGRPCHDAIN